MAGCCPCQCHRCPLVTTLLPLQRLVTAGDLPCGSERIGPLMARLDRSLDMEDRGQELKLYSSPKPSPPPPPHFGRCSLHRRLVFRVPAAKREGLQVRQTNILRDIDLDKRWHLILAAGFLNLAYAIVAWCPSCCHVISQLALLSNALFREHLYLSSSWFHHWQVRCHRIPATKNDGGNPYKPYGDL